MKKVKNDFLLKDKDGKELWLWTEADTAFDSIKNACDIDTLRYYVLTGVYRLNLKITDWYVENTQQSIYTETVNFFDKHEDEIVRYVMDNSNMLKEGIDLNVFAKTDFVSTYIELISEKIYNEAKPNSALWELYLDYEEEDLENIWCGSRCIGGAAHCHQTEAETVPFFDKHEDEIVSYIINHWDECILTDLFEESKGNLNKYKNDVVWFYIEWAAQRHLPFIYKQEEEEEEDYDDEE
ncbi:hypothetical protein [Prochlorococcus marinus]|uniref:hypothetical protein n=1 Tax=Prochlorococcus marinus TaxID=1219 RepID=UPI0022B2CE61|nr:hypothetical protein [Prochlorococcus marinus]